MSEYHEALVIGAGFGGLCVAHRLAEEGVDDVVLLERRGGVGGTWRANTYPGAACDVPSHLYSLSFATKPDWTRAYATQPEILEYIEDCYDRLDIRRKVRLGVTIREAQWCDKVGRWRVHDTEGHRWEGRVLVSAVGTFNTPSVPGIEGAGTFEGTSFHSAEWDYGHDVAGKRVAVVGTGASAVQIVPAIAGPAAHVDVYQRTAPWVVPRRDKPYTEEQKRTFASDPTTTLQHRRELHELFEETTAFILDDPSVELIAGVARRHLEAQVADPELRGRLTPGQRFGCQRTLVSSDWYPTLARDDVELVTTPIDCITVEGIRTVDGVERRVDTIIWCTGFRAGDYLHGIEVIGRLGADLHRRWAGVPRAYLGMCVPEFPNFFMLYGPNTNQGGNSILLILEAQAQFVASALGALRAANAETIEVSNEAMRRYVAELERDLGRTVWSAGCTSYFHNDAGDIVTQLPHTSGWYAAATAQIDLDDFVLHGPSEGRRPTVPAMSAMTESGETS